MQNEDNFPIFRVVIIGDSSVGKTSIIQYHMKGVFYESQKNTVGAVMDTYSTTYQGKNLQIQLWDTAGQERYRSLVPVYFRGAAAAIIVFDISNSESFSNLDIWYDSLTQVTSDSVGLILVGNKIDLQERIIRFEDANHWATEHHCSYMETSAKTGEGIALCFTQLVNLLEESIKDHLGAEASHENESPALESGCSC